MRLNEFFSDETVKKLEEARNEETLSGRLLELANSGELVVAIKVLQNPNAPDEAYEQVIKGQNPAISFVEAGDGYSKFLLKTVESMRQACLGGKSTLYGRSRCSNRAA